jgi:diaminopimelate decarboxylase
MPCYALKANYNPTLLKLIAQNGLGADVVSGGELYFARRAGIAPEKIVFAGVGKSEAEIGQAIQLKIHSLNIESESELRVIEKVAQRLNKRVTVAVRVNPDIDAETHPYISTGLHSNKFGVTRETAINLLQRAAKHPFIDPGGIHVHIGSQIDHKEPYIETAHYLLDMHAELEHLGINIHFIDLGGGIGINYNNQLDEAENKVTYISNILPALLKPFKNKKIKILIELGRSIIGSAGFLVTRVIYIKNTPQKKFIIVDAAMNNLLRPSLYQAYHQILPLRNDHTMIEKADVVGPVCESSDFLAKGRELPVVNEGDFLVVTGAGAYGQALASAYNLRPAIPEYLVDGENIDVIFAGDTVESIADRYKW